MYAKFQDQEKLQEQIDAYFDHCESTREVYHLKNGDIKIRQEYPSMVGLALWLHCSPDTLYSYINKESKVSISEEMLNSISDTLARAQSRITLITLNAAAVGDYEQRTAQLVLSKYLGTSATDATVTIKVEGANADDVAAWSK